MASRVDLDIDEPPPIFYKYSPPERNDVLEMMHVRSSPPSDFNDTFDSHFLVPKSRGREGILDRIRLKNALGILSLTERSDNHLMWVNYARNHTGFVLGLDS